ncbi:hypothetical protein Q0X79_08035 [Neisseria sp. MVDL18-041461]|nr:MULTISPECIES: hypothetical protein [unclassified Neisseria]MDO1510404.1 hypothetical protein [Neisseria sp. MVDL19-042950]MDO1516573.1 hypothetical protein [Neisseria sp. MVDL18-041461]
MHFAATGYTAAELVYRRVDASKPVNGFNAYDRWRSS